MRQSKLLSQKHKEKPAEATLASHIYLLRGGYIRPVANGIYSLLMPAKRIQKKIEAIIREEMDKCDGQEVMMPVVMPRELWDESGRWNSVSSELLRFKDRTGHDMLLGMTHEEAYELMMQLRESGKYNPSTTALPLIGQVRKKLHLA